MAGLAFVSEYIYGVFLLIYATSEILSLIKNRKLNLFLKRNTFAFIGFIPSLLIFFWHNLYISGSVFIIPESLYESISLSSRFSTKNLALYILIK